MDLSIIIVNWNSAAYLRKCLASIFRHSPQLQFEVIVVDNASYDGAERMVAEQFPAVKFVQSKHNLGFGKANNLAYAHSKGSTILFVNPDTELLDGAIDQMHAHLQSQAGIGAVGCRMLNSDMSLQTKYVKAFPNLSNQFLTADRIIRMFPKSRLWGIRPILECGSGHAEVDVLAGSCIMVKRAVFEKVGRFSEEYFMYTEDVDLCYAIRKAGLKIHYLGSGHIVHHSEKSSSSCEQSHFAAIMQRESLARFFRKTKGSIYAEMYRGTVAAAALLRLFGMSAALPILTLLGHDHLSASRKKWFKLLRWSLGLERWVATMGKEPHTA